MAVRDFRWNQDRVMARVNTTMQARANVAARAVETQVKARISTPFPPASAPGTPPHRRRGVLQRSVRAVWRRLSRNRLRVQVTVAAPYAWLLQRGTRFMRRRPFLGLPADARLIVDILSGRRRG